jgi:hypothetical protein
MPTPLWEIDPVSEDAANVPLSLVGTVNSVDFRLIEMDLTPQDIDPRTRRRWTRRATHSSARVTGTRRSA